MLHNFTLFEKILMKSMGFQETVTVYYEIYEQ